MTQEEFKKCFDDWFDELRNYITYRCYDSELATDLVQEAYVRIWEKNTDYMGSRTRALLYKISKELWISQYRKLNSEKKYMLSLSYKNDHNETENQVYYEELKEKYEKALINLPEKRRVVFLMSRMEELTYSEIAERLSISVKAVEKRMKLALQELRNIIGHEAR
ncbi:MAG: sigma-70 family RNA polymerase sigma factor [Cytophagales bacterium]|nr:sigma-70 family RNA polymerase sigma factor [Cytophagales bacterium]